MEIGLLLGLSVAAVERRSDVEDVDAGEIRGVQDVRARASVALLALMAAASMVWASPPLTTPPL
ncbi:MAG: hypothetical protein R3B68_10065 [Phycisphaerales bacterium]